MTDVIVYFQLKKLGCVAEVEEDPKNYSFFHHLAAEIPTLSQAQEDKKAELARETIINRIIDDKGNFMKVTQFRFTVMHCSFSKICDRSSCKRPNISFQSWLEEYLRGTNYNFLSYLAAKQNERAEVDGLLVLMSAYYLGRVITIIMVNGNWSSEQTVYSDIVLLHRGGNQFMSSTSK